MLNSTKTGRHPQPKTNSEHHSQLAHDSAPTPLRCFNKPYVLHDTIHAGSFRNAYGQIPPRGALDCQFGRQFAITGRSFQPPLADS